MRRVCLLLLALSAARPELLTIPISRAPAEDALDPAASVWKTAAGADLPLNRTPLLYATDAPAALEIPVVQVKILNAAGKSVVRLEWKDKSQDKALLPAAKNTWQSGTVVEQSPATNQFFDACAVMVPARPPADDVSPSLQMGDPEHPVMMYYVDSARGPALMEGAGRGTTRRTGKTFASRFVYAAGAWTVTLEMPAIASGTPIAVAVWNGSQQDRDGRKYFSVWHRTR